ncbi:MAG: Mu transposase C-terminal domain-containing protein [Treponema sp.]|jgi:transposase InsO family protein|nr:Mu transposase C-terminal domain-containing protein [Treponema sp.]
MTNKRLTENEIAKLLSISKRGVNKRAKNDKNWPSPCICTTRGGKANSYEIKKLPEDVQAAYAASIGIGLTDLRKELSSLLLPQKKIHIPGFAGRGAKTRAAKNYDKLPEKYQIVANERRKVLEAYSDSEMSAAQFIKAYNNGEIVSELRVKLGSYGNITAPSSLYRWLEQYEQDGLAGLAPQYAGKGAGACLPQEAKDRIEWLYLDSSQPSVNAVYDLLAQYNIKASKATVRRYINSLPEWIKAKYRKGKDYFKEKFSPYIVRDYTKYKPMEIICGDYMTQDIVCRKGDRVFRAKLCAFEDMRSRTITGWSLQETANSIGVIRALQMTFQEFGLPEKAYVDNGKEFKNYLLCGGQWKARKTKIDPELLDMDVGILAECGVKVIFCQAYNGQSKPIERFWRFFHDRFDRFELTYMGSNTADRPDEAKVFRSNVENMKKEDISLIPTFEEVVARIGRFIQWYNEKWNHSGQGMDGRTPMQVFNEYAMPKREIPDHIKKYLFTMRYIRTVQRNGIELDKIFYQHEEFINLNGKEVEVRRGLNDAGMVHIFSVPDRVYLFDAENLVFTGVPQEDIRAMSKLKKDMSNLEKKYNKKKAEYDQGVFKTPAEIYAEETRKASGGEKPRAPARVFPVKLKPKKAKKIIGIFDVE